MNEDPDDVFLQMDTMVGRILSDMNRIFPAGMPPHNGGFRIIIGRKIPVNGRTPRGIEIQPRDICSPSPEVHRIGDEVKVVTALPGADKDSIRLNICGTALTIDAVSSGQQIRTGAELPPIDAGSVQTSYKNGVLEVTFAAKPKENPENK